MNENKLLYVLILVRNIEAKIEAILRISNFIFLVLL